MILQLHTGATHAETVHGQDFWMRSCSACGQGAVPCRVERLDRVVDGRRGAAKDEEPPSRRAAAAP